MGFRGSAAGDRPITAILLFAVSLCVSFFITGCQSDLITPPLSSTSNLNLISSPTPTSSPTIAGSSVAVSWTANREADVNTSGGGYNVYYSTQSGFSIVGASYVNVPYVSGASSPTSAVISGLSSSTTYYIEVVAYSSFGTSAPSSSFTVNVP